jgi:photosystem II stability/assembly factor-like uncharacterized protein
MLASGLIMVRPPMVSPFLPWRFTAAALACLTGTLMACSEAPSQPLLVSLRIFPANPVVLEGKSTPLTATGVFSDSSRQDLTESVRWSSSSSRFVSISDEAGSRGLITGVAHGTATIRAVHDASGQTAEALAIVPFPPPMLSSVQPTKGPRTGGTAITLTGKWFEPGSIVTIGGVPVSNLRIVSETTATALTPTGTAGPQDVVVQATLGSATLPGGFTYRGAPVLTRVQPSSGPVYGGTVITLQGTDLTPDTAITLGGAPLLNLTPVDDTTMTGTTPPGTAGSKDVVSSNNLGSTTSQGGFTYVDPWRPANTGLDGGSVNKLASHPSNPSLIYAGTEGGGVFRSTNAGQTWAPINQGLKDLTIHELAIDPDTPTTLYVGTGNGLFKSTDGGEAWFSPSSTLERGIIGALVLTRELGTAVYASAGGRGLFKSSDGGATWAAINTGLTSPFSINSLAVNPSNALVLYAGGVSAIFKTTNGGQSWSPTGAVPTAANGIWDLAIDPSAPDTIYAATNDGVYASSNGGTSWASASTGLSSRYVQSVRLVAGTPTTLYACTSSGLYKSTTGGASWSGVNTGLTTLALRALLAEPGNPSTLYAGTWEGGVFKTTNGATSWTSSKRGLSSAEVFAIAFSPAAPDIAYAATRDGLFKTMDAGESWSDVTQGLDSRGVYAVVAHPADPAIAYAGTFNGLYKTVDGGASWSSVLTASSSGFSILAFHPASPETIYAGTTQRLFKSVNGGASWTPLTQGLPSIMWVWSIVFSPRNPSTVFIASSSKVYRSTDDGEQWVEVSGVLPTDNGSQELWVVPGPVEALYVASANHGLFKTVNGGASWEELFFNNAGALAIHPQDPQVMYVGPLGSTSPLEMSRDGGRTWVPASLPFLTSVEVLAMKPGDPQTILAGTRHRGVFKTTTGGQ